MEIRITALRLRNFKGVRMAEYYFGGRNARLEGPNGSGKSTVFDAFTWLLFGKDHRDQTTDTFELKTIDPSTGKPYPREDHWVEGVLNVDGQDHVLRRAWIENWVKPTGEIEDVMKGHTSAFYVDGVDVGTKAAYDAVVSGWLREDSFKLLTNPHYFIDDAFTAWKDRRKALLDLVKDAPEREAVRKEFSDVVGKLSGRSIEDYRKRLALEKAANKRDLANVLSRIEGMREALPEEQDNSAVTLRLEQLRSQRDAALAALKKEAEEIDRKIASADEADAARKAENAAIWSEITKVQLKMGNYLAEATKAALEQNNRRNIAIIEASTKRLAALADMKARKDEEDRAIEAISKMEAERGRMASRLADLGNSYRDEKARAFEYTPQTVCPTCGQEIPAASIEEARAKAEALFKAERKDVLGHIVNDAKALKEEIAKHDARIAGQKDIVFKAAEDYDLADTEATKWSVELKRLEAQPKADLAAIEAEARGSEEYKALAAQERDLRAKALKTSCRPDDAADLVNKRKEIDERISAVAERFAKEELAAQEALSVGKVRAEQLELIRRKENQAKAFADALAACEREEARAAEFVKADIDSVETAISGLFHTARWKMFDTTMEGGIVETCEVTSPDGVPYRSMNDAMKILCGLDCIRVFSKRFGTVAPIFIDNAEGILRDRFDTSAQVIRLVVADTAKLNLVNE